MFPYQTFVDMEKARVTSPIDLHVENVLRRGYTVLENLISPEECEDYCQRLDVLWDRQVAEFGDERLRQLKDHGIVRCPLSQDRKFTELVMHPRVLEVLDRVLGSTAILHLQNGIVVHPTTVHQQSLFHRDFAKSFISNHPLSINVLWAMRPFTKETGATWVVPGTHNTQLVPSDEYTEANAVQLEASPGSAVLFDSMLWHGGGQNKTDRRRHAVNHQYTKPFIKQQIDLPVLLAGMYDPETPLGQKLGFWAIPPKSIAEFRADPDKRTYRPGQG